MDGWRRNEGRRDFSLRFYFFKPFNEEFCWYRGRHQDNFDNPSLPQVSSDIVFFSTRAIVMRFTSSCYRGGLLASSLYAIVGRGRETGLTSCGHAFITGEILSCLK